MTSRGFSPGDLSRLRRPVREAAIGYATSSASPEALELLDRMQALHDSAIALDGAIRANVKPSLFRGSWEAWLSDWTRYYRLAQGGRMLLDEEDLRERLDGYGEDLAGWHDGYAVERRAAGAFFPRVPQPAAGAEPPAKKGSLLPWWAWMVGGAAALGGAYYLARGPVAAVGRFAGSARDAVLRLRAPAARAIETTTTEASAQATRLLPP